MEKINVDNVSQRRKKMAERRNIQLNRYKKRTTRDHIILLRVYPQDDMPAEELIDKLRDLVAEYDNVVVAVDDEAALDNRFYYDESVYSVVLYASFERPETDEEAAVRVIREYDEKKAREKERKKKKLREEYLKKIEEIDNEQDK